MPEHQVQGISHSPAFFLVSCLSPAVPYSSGIAVCQYIPGFCLWSALSSEIPKLAPGHLKTSPHKPESYSDLKSPQHLLQEKKPVPSQDCSRGLPVWDRKETLLTQQRLGMLSLDLHIILPRVSPEKACLRIRWGSMQRQRQRPTERERKYDDTNSLLESDQAQEVWELC